MQSMQKSPSARQSRKNYLTKDISDAMQTLCQCRAAANYKHLAAQVCARVCILAFLVKVLMSKAAGLVLINVNISLHLQLTHVKYF